MLLPRKTTQEAKRNLKHFGGNMDEQAQFYLYKKQMWNCGLLRWWFQQTIHMVPLDKPCSFQTLFTKVCFFKRQVPVRPTKQAKAIASQLLPGVLSYISLNEDHLPSKHRDISLLAPMFLNALRGCDVYNNDIERPKYNLLNHSFECELYGKKMNKKWLASSFCMVKVIALMSLATSINM